ncbi:MAG TPA: response regulator [Nitrospira sp.]|nr:response regulator [Nitrospira sp.]
MSSPIFVVDSSPAVRRLVEQLSAPEGFDVMGFQDGPAALEAARQMSPSLIIADYQLSNITFSGFCKAIQQLDHLAETSLISLVNPADRPDEKHLRTLGVKAFLHKPIQSDDLLTLIKSIQRQHEGAVSKGLKRRTWPPTSTGADDEDDDAPNPVFRSTAADQAGEQENNPVRLASIMPAAPSDTGDQKIAVSAQHLQSLAQRSQPPPAPRRNSDDDDVKLSINVQPIVQKEVQAQLGTILSQEYLVAIIHPLVSRELPSLLDKEMPNIEPIIKQSVSDMVASAIKAALDQWVHEQAETSIRKFLPTVIHEQIGSIDQLVKDEIQAVALKQAPLLAEDLVRTVAQDTVGQAVQKIVPDLAEQEIKAELKRLTGEP